jgi:arylsulfatase A
MSMLRSPRRSLGRTSSWLIYLVTGVLASISCGQLTTANAETTKPNFIVVFCDNLGYGDIEPFGSRLHRTPNLNRMAVEGRKFTHFCVTAGVCTPSRSSLMTGCYAQRVGMHDNPRDGQVLRPVSPYGLNPNETTIAEVLKPLGYATAMIGKWHLGDQPEFLPTRQGFDSYSGIPYSDDMTADRGREVAPLVDGKVWPELPLMQNETVIEAPVDRNELTRRYTEKAIEFIEAHRAEPFFLYLPQAMPGSTREPFASAAFRGKSKNGPWGDSVEELDWSQGKILDKLVELGIDDSTLVIWTSDNGAPALRDSPARGSNKPLHGVGYTTSEGAFRVPTIAWWPGTIPANSVCDQLATTMDLLPTFARLAGLPASEAPSPNRIDGYDIRPLLLGEQNAKSPYSAFYYYERDQLQAIRRGPWKLFVPLQEFTKHPHFKANQTATTLLFNVETDIGSTTNVADQNPEVVAELLRFAEEARLDIGDRGRPGSGQRVAGYQANPTARLLTPNP